MPKQRTMWHQYTNFPRKRWLIPISTISLFFPKILTIFFLKIVLFCFLLTFFFGGGGRGMKNYIIGGLHSNLCYLGVNFCGQEKLSWPFMYQILQRKRGPRYANGSKLWPMFATHPIPTSHWIPARKYTTLIHIKVNLVHC